MNHFYKRIVRRTQDFFFKLALLLSNSYRIGFSSRISQTRLGKYCSIGHKSYVASCRFGDFSYIGDNCVIRSTLIGSFCSIGSNVQISLGTHPVNEFVSTSPVFYSPSSPLPISFTEEHTFNEHSNVEGSNYNVLIGNDVWIGDKVTICDSVVIGDGAIIAYGSFVNKSVEPYEIVGGIPAKHLKYRFSDEIKSRLLKSRWWNYPLTFLIEKVHSFKDPTQFPENTKSNFF